ncbi:amino acid adenylation domain-containing protein [Amycolatopsis keratiniphila]|uniref:non-ribosomal peptide synthetase n=1 Tax=Amycolatopsis keratiniphila TaxID=129921 RepID=UPI00340FE10C
MRSATRKEEALWLLERLVPGSGVNNLHLAFRVSGELDLVLLDRVLSVLVRRHPALRTVFRAGETGLSKEVHDDLPVAFEDRECSADEVDARLAEFVAEPFELDGGALLRALRLRCPGEDVCCVIVHHLNFDTVSAAVLHEEFVAVYNAFAAGDALPPELEGTAATLDEVEPKPESLAFWRDQLREVRPDELELSCGRPDVAEPNLAGAQVTWQFAAETVEVVRELRKALRVPEAVVLLAAYYLLLHAHGAGPDLVVGSPMNVRGRETARAVGYHVNVTPLRLRVDPAEDFRGLVRRVRGVFFGALTHLDVPVDNLLAEIPRTGSSWRHTVFRHVFNYIPETGAPSFRLGGLPAEPLAAEPGFSKFDLEFFLLPATDGIRVRAAYYTEVLGQADVQAFVRRYEALLSSLAENLDRPVGDARAFSAEDDAVIGKANRTGKPVAWSSVPSAVAAAVEAAPDAVAVEEGDRAVTYRQLWDTAAATSERLREAGVAPGEVVALVAPRGAELAAAALGVWLAGATYLPLDPDHPEQRIAYQLADSGAKVALSDAAIPAGTGCRALALTPVGSVPSKPASPLPVTGAPAYLIYTSGSTGRPKGTVVGHPALANLISHFADELGHRGQAGTLWLTTFSFDISALELFLPLATGGRLVVAPDEARVDGGALKELLDRHEVSTLQATPTTWRLVVDDVSGELTGKTVLCGGEPLPVSLARRLVDTGCELWNVYGPTETTIWSTAGRVHDGATGRITAGAPIGNTTVFLADPNGREVPVGVTGELCIAGAGLAEGYHDRPELTEARFAVHPRHGRFYRTGDLARWLEDGTLELLGRADRQIKLRGNRIELTEVESVLLAHDEVAGAAVVVADEVLVAYVEADTEPGLVDRLWAHAGALLPKSAVPQEFVVVDRIPLTGNDKVDYPELVRRAADLAAERVTTPAEERELDPVTAEVVALFRELLDRGDVGPGTNFFAHGGHSLLAAKLAQRVKHLTGVRVRLTDVFAHPTPAALADFVRAASE